MFSKTTIELSTNIPMPKSKPAMLIMLIVIPLKYIKKSVMQTEIGIAKPMMIVLLNEHKKTNTTNMANQAPWITDFTTSLIVCSMMSVVL